ncbi:unnamed protein product, partial [Meganyctiphanes norvegica]
MEVIMVVQFGQVVLGPPGSGKTTYCAAIAKFLKSIGRKVAIVNLDPANEDVPYESTVDINNLVRVEEVMSTQNIGPNGALVYCMEMLESNLSWLMDKLEIYYQCMLTLPPRGVLCNKRSEFTIIIAELSRKTLLCIIFLLSKSQLHKHRKFISALLLALNSMLHMELPTVNVLSKVDSIEKYGTLAMGLDYYTEVLDLEYLLDTLEDVPVSKKFRKLHKTIADVVTDYSLVSFVPVSVEVHSTLMNVMRAVDKANGYVYGSGEERNIQRLLSCAVGSEFEGKRLDNLDGFTEGTSSDEERDAKDDEILRMLAHQNVGR